MTTPVAESIAKDLGYKKKMPSTATWWGACFDCGAPDAFVGADGFGCPSCGISYELGQLPDEISTAQAIRALDWGEPDIPRPPTATALPVEALPRVLRDHVESVAASVQVHEPLAPI